LYQRWDEGAGLVLLGLPVFLVALATGCAGSRPDANGGAGASAGSLNPPANVDAVACSNIGPEADATAINSTNSCLDCCNAKGFPDSTFFENRCVCGKPLDDQGDIVCASMAATNDSCNACCRAAAYTGHGWLSAPGTTSCSCFGKSDAMVCAGALAAADPGAACTLCCLNHGYLDDDYEGFGTRVCRCIDH